MNAARSTPQYWWDRPIRICPTEWCQCPHQEAGPDDRCRECRRRPANAERHGASLVTIATVSGAAVWRGPWGSCYTAHAVPVEDRDQHRADWEVCERAAKALNREELLAWLLTTGADLPTKIKMTELRGAAAIRQMDLWWPRKFLPAKGA